MQAVLYVSHGSRVEVARWEAVAFIQSVRNRINSPLQETCFLELAEPDMAEGIANLVKRGATKIAVVPVLLLRAGHYYRDIPDEIKRAKARFPNIQFSYGQPIGVQDRIVDILKNRIEETQVARHPDANILLVGRGSRDSETAESIEKIASKLKEKMDLTNVSISYLAACSPSFSEALETAVKKGYPQTFVVPYLWFTGLLMQSMRDRINKIQQTGQQFVLCQYLGDHPIMVEALSDRVHEALDH